MLMNVNPCAEGWMDWAASKVRLGRARLAGGAPAFPLPGEHLLGPTRPFPQPPREQPSLALFRLATICCCSDELSSSTLAAVPRVPVKSVDFFFLSNDCFSFSCVVPSNFQG